MANLVIKTLSLIGLILCVLVVAFCTGLLVQSMAYLLVVGIPMMACLYGAVSCFSTFNNPSAFWAQ